MAFAGHYFEFSISSLSKPGQKGTIKTWFQDGNTRSEVHFENQPMMGQMVGLTLNDKPGKIFVLNETAKSYMEVADNQEEKNNKTEYTFQNLGTESVLGYTCTHIQVQKKGENYKSDYWLSKEVKGYAQMKKVKGKYLAESNLMKLFEEKGWDGYPVKMVMGTEDGQMQMELVKAEEIQIPLTKFSLEGYSKTQMPALPQQMDVEKIKNMSPAERQKWMEEMMKQYGK